MSTLTDLDAEEIFAKNKPERIIGATDSSGELLFLIQWEGVNKAQLVRSNSVRKHCPQLVSFNKKLKKKYSLN